MKKNKILLKIIFFIIIFSGSFLSGHSKEITFNTMSPKSIFENGNIGYGIVNSPRLNAHINDNKEFHKIMTNPENSNFFGGLFYSVRKFLQTNDESFRPFVVLHTLGGGADIAGAIMQGMYIVHIIKENPEIKNLFKTKYGEELTEQSLIQKKLLEFTYIGCPEKRLSHQGIYSSQNYKTKAPHHAFINGTLDTKAGIMPEVIEGSTRVSITTGKNITKQLKYFHRVTPEMKFVKETIDPDTKNEIRIEGTPLEDHKMSPFSSETLGMDIYLLALHGTIGDTSHELYEFLKYRVSKTPEGKSIISPSKRSLRPCFIWVPDTGGDTFSKRDEDSTKNLIISPVNEAYNLLVLSGLLFKKNNLELCVNFTPFAWGTDGESTASVINKTIFNLHNKGAIDGMVYRIPPKILQYTLVNVFGLTNNKPPVLQSHANFKALKLLWKSSVFHDLKIREAPPGSLEDFIEKLKPLQDIGEMKRDDVPVLDVETIIAASSEGGAHELMTILNAYKAIQYFLEINKININDIKDMTYLKLRNFLESSHLVTGENQLPSFSEYELMKAVVLRNASLSSIARDEKNSDYLIPRWSTKERFKSNNCPEANIKDAVIYLGRFEKKLEDGIGAEGIFAGKDFMSLRKNLVQKYLRDLIGEKNLVTGFLRINSRYILAYFQNDFPNIYRELKKSNMANKISDIIYEEISHELIEVIEEAKRNSQNPQFLESLSHKIINDLPLENDDEKMVAAALKILRINPKASKFFFQNLQQLYDKIIPISTTIVETQRKILIGYINNVMNEYLNKTPYTDFTEPFDLVYIDDLKIERVIRLIQQLVKDLGTNSGEYEKLYKSLTNLIMHSLETTASHQRYYAKSHAEIPDFVQKRLSTLYKSMTLLYYIMPENIDEKPDKEIFNQYYELHPFSKVREGLYAVRKNIRGEGFIKLLNGMAYKQLIQYQDMRPDFLNKRDLNLLTGLFICTSSPEHTAFFQEPILSFLNPDILRGITRNFDNRVTAERNEIEKLRNLKHQLEKAIDYDINKVGSSDNILKALRDIMGNNSALFTDFFIMLQNGLLAGLSTKEHIDQKIQLLEDHQKKLFKDFAYLTSLISPKLKDVLFDKSA